MARAKQTARKCMPGKAPGAVQQVVPSMSLLVCEGRPTGRAYLALLEQSGAQEAGVETLQQEVGSRSNAGVPSIAEARTALPSLGPDLLQRVFAKLGAHPKDLVPLGAVCKEWRSVLTEITWKDLCLKYAGGMVAELGYNKGGKLPPGGWIGLYKLLVYCPGLCYPTFDYVRDSELLPDYDAEADFSHLVKGPQGFWKGPEAEEAASLATRFASDEIYISSVCQHCRAVRHCDHQGQSLPVFALRGIVKDIRHSGLAEVSGALAYLDQLESMCQDVSDDKGLALVDGSKSENGVDRDGMEYSIDGSGKEAERIVETGAELAVVARKGRSEEMELLDCPFCGQLLFALDQECFPGTFPDYDELFAATTDEEIAIEHGLSEEDNPKLLTGLVCLEGHILLGGVSYSKDVRGLPVEQSGEGLQLEPTDAVGYVRSYGREQAEWEIEEGQQVIRGLGLDTLIKMSARLGGLLQEWPSCQTDGGRSYWVFSTCKWEAFKRGPLSICDLLESGSIPKHLQTSIKKYILKEELSLQECLGLINAELAAEERKKKETERETHLVWLLSRASVPNPMRSKDAAVKDLVNEYVKEGTISIEDVAQQLKALHGKDLERRKLEKQARSSVQSGMPQKAPHPEVPDILKCTVLKYGVQCRNTAGKGCMHGGCRPCCLANFGLLRDCGVHKLGR